MKPQDKHTQIELSLAAVDAELARLFSSIDAALNSRAAGGVSRQFA